MNRRLKFALDTQLFIHALHDEAAKTAFNRFHQHCAPFVHLSVIVAQELRAGMGDRFFLRRSPGIARVTCSPKWQQKKGSS